MRFRLTMSLTCFELRLGQLDSVVDKFVIVETGLTYRGIPKPLYYQENKHLFEKYNHKIIAVDSRTPKMGAWYFEQVQRNVLSDVIRQLASSDDTISFSDCDEIPNPEVVATYIPGMGLRNLKQYTYYYNFNCLMNYGRREWSRARIGTVQDFLHWGAYEFRQGPRDLDHSHPSIENGGWHGSYFNVTLERLRRKVHSISHDDMDHAVDSVSDAVLLDTVLKRQDLFHRSGVGDGQHIEIPDTVKHPPFFLENLERFKMFTEQHYRDMVGKVSTQETLLNVQQELKKEEPIAIRIDSSAPRRILRRG